MVTIVTLENKDRTPVPALTIVSYNETWGGWKQSVGNGLSSLDIIDVVCGNYEDLALCIKENTHSLDDLLLVELGSEQNVSLMEPSLWH